MIKLNQMQDSKLKDNLIDKNLTLCLLGYCSYFCWHLLTFFQNIFFHWLLFSRIFLIIGKLREDLSSADNLGNQIGSGSGRTVRHDQDSN